MSDYPKTIMDFTEKFSTEKDCWNHLFKVRWPKGFKCPRCGAKEYTRIKTRGLIECKKGHQISVTNDTVMHGSHTPLKKWFWAAYLMTTQTPGISAMVLHRQIGVCYETAYMMLQKLRAGLVNPDRTSLYGTVEVDEAYISAGWVRKTRSGRGSGKPMVVVAVESHGTTAGRVRLRRIGSASEKELSRFILDHVERGSTIVTDSWSGYHNIGRYGYKTEMAESESLKHVHRTISNLKAWLIGTHHGVSAKHLQAYLNEFTFRRNRHNLPMAAFETALGIGAITNSPKYEELYSAGEKYGWVHPNPDGK